MKAAVSMMALGLSLAGSALAAGEAPAGKLLMFSTQARIEVDSQGKVVAVTPDPALPAAVGAAIQSTVGSWRFTPPAKEGRAVNGVTFVQLGACAVPEAGNYRFAVAYRGNGPARSGPPAPRFPLREMRAGHSSKLQLNYSVLANGTARIDEITVLEGSKRADQRAFRGAVENWVNAIKFEPELVDGVPVVTKMSYPIVFMAGGTQSFSSFQAARKKFEKEDQARAAAQPSCQTALGASDNSDRQVALDSPFQLLPPG